MHNEGTQTVPIQDLVDMLPRGWAATIKERLGKYTKGHIYQVVKYGWRKNKDIEDCAWALMREHQASLSSKRTVLTTITNSTPMKLYITGSSNQEDLLRLADKVKVQGHNPVTPYDVIDENRTDDENLVVRLQEVLSCEGVVTTSPAMGAWGEGADREVKVARAANMRVVPEMNLQSIAIA
jgi:hypothetical protein